MSLRAPNLDDRSFDDLVAEALRVIERSCPQWTDRGPSDPGMVMVDVFAYLTEAMLYRLNRLPEKAYIEFLRLIGVKLHAPAAASVMLRFKLNRPATQAVTIPRGTRVTVAGGAKEPPLFATVTPVTIDAGADTVDVLAFHAIPIDAELAGHGTGLPGLSLTLRQTPVVAATDERLRLFVGVESDAAQLGPEVAAIEYNGKAFRVWNEVGSFSDPVEDRHVFVVDRITGTISFAPSIRMSGPDGELGELEALAEVPAKGAEIRVWYYVGGGTTGNVSSDTLSQLKDAVAGVQVSNPRAASGGRDVEALSNALQRGAQEIHSLHRAVTARDFELLARQSSGAVERARAFTRVAIWSHAQPGTVEVVLVPAVPRQLLVDGRVDLELLHAHENETSLRQIQSALDLRRPLGTLCLLSWARYKPVQVRATLVVYREEDPKAVEARLMRRLNETISPLTGNGDTDSWPFGHTLTNWHMYKVLSAEPGVRAVSKLSLVVDSAPETNVTAVSVDAFQPHTWYAASGESLFRTMNNGDGWEMVQSFDGDTIVLVKAYPREAAAPTATGQRPARAGLLAIATNLAKDEGASQLHFSYDCGESWEAGPRTDFRITDMCWVERPGGVTLLLATEVGLYQVTVKHDAVPEQLVVDPANLGLGFYAVTASTDAMGVTSVAVAARGKQGVYLSHDGGKSKSFKMIGLKDQEVRVLEVQHRGLHRYLWAGIAAVGEDPGAGAHRWLLTGAEDNTEGWIAFGKGWSASSCRGLAFDDNRIYAASRRGGLLTLDVDARDPVWQAPAVDCGLPLRELKKFDSVDSVACSPDGGPLMCAGPKGVLRSRDKGSRFESCSGREFLDQVTLPPTWLFCSAVHQLTVVTEDEA